MHEIRMMTGLVTRKVKKINNAPGLSFLKKDNRQGQRSLTPPLPESNGTQPHNTAMFTAPLNKMHNLDGVYRHTAWPARI